MPWSTAEDDQRREHCEVSTPQTDACPASLSLKKERRKTKRGGHLTAFRVPRALTRRGAQISSSELGSKVILLFLG